MGPGEAHASAHASLLPVDDGPVCQGPAVRLAGPWIAPDRRGGPRGRGLGQLCGHGA